MPKELLRKRVHLQVIEFVKWWIRCKGCQLSKAEIADGRARGQKGKTRTTMNLASLILIALKLLDNPNRLTIKGSKA